MVKQHPKFNNHAHNVLNINQLMFKMAVIDFFFNFPIFCPAKTQHKIIHLRLVKFEFFYFLNIYLTFRIRIILISIKSDFDPKMKIKIELK